MGTVKDILEFFVTFGIVDNIIIYMFFRKFGNCPKNKWYQLLICMIFTSITKVLLPKVLYQLTIFLFLILYNLFVNKFKILYGFKITFYLHIFFLISESLYVMIFDFLNIVDITNIKNFIYMFMTMIPNKILNIIIILKGEKLWEFFFGEKTQKKK